MRFLRHVGKGYGSRWIGVIFDHHYKNLNDLIEKSKRLFSQFNDGAKFLSSNSDLKWVWPTGEQLLFRAAAKLRDYDDYHGHEYPFIGWNELTKYASPELFRKMLSTNRVTWERPPKGQLGWDVPDPPCEVFATTNSYGVGRNWVKREFIDPAPYGKIQRKSVTLDKPGSPGVMISVELTQVALFGSWKENPYLPAEYIAEMMQEPNEALRESWVNGSWDIVAGGAFDDVWDPRVHILPRFKIPKGWRLDRAFDWGSTHPFYVGWFAESDGETQATIDFNGRSFAFCPPKGSLVLFAEWYGAHKTKHNAGTKMSAPDIAAGIRKYEKAMLEVGWIDGSVSPGPADDQIWGVTQSDELTIAQKFSEAGVEWERAHKGVAGRKNGLELVRAMFIAAKRREGKGLWFMRHCQASITTLPSLPRDEDDMEDVDTDAEDHPYDAIRYRVVSSTQKVTKSPTVQFF